jgi:hypothetical protein
MSLPVYFFDITNTLSHEYQNSHKGLFASKYKWRSDAVALTHEDDDNAGFSRLFLFRESAQPTSSK